MKKILYLILLCAVVFIVSACGTVPQVSPNNSLDEIIPDGKFYFKSKTCAHCAVVDKYISDANLKQKLFFITRDIESDLNAVPLLKTIGKKCLLSDTEIGVPLFWDGTNCYLGDVKVIEYFKTLN